MLHVALITLTVALTLTLMLTFTLTLTLTRALPVTFPLTDPNRRHRVVSLDMSGVARCVHDGFPVCALRLMLFSSQLLLRFQR